MQKRACPKGPGASSQSIVLEAGVRAQAVGPMDPKRPVRASE